MCVRVEPPSFYSSPSPSPSPSPVKINNTKMHLARKIDDSNASHATRLDEVSTSLRSDHDSIRSDLSTHSSRLDHVASTLRSDHETIRSDLSSALDTHTSRLNDVAATLRSDHESIRTDMTGHTARLSETEAAMRTEHEAIRSDVSQAIQGVTATVQAQHESHTNEAEALRSEHTVGTVLVQPYCRCFLHPRTPIPRSSLRSHPHRDPRLIHRHASLR